MLHARGELLVIVLATHAVGQQCVAAGLPVIAIGDVFFGEVAHRLRRHQFPDFFHGRVQHRVLPDHHRRRALAAAQARGGQHAHILAQYGGQAREQILRTGHFAGQGLAHTHRHRGRHGITRFNDVKVMIKGRHFVDFALRHGQFGRQRGQMALGQVAVAILDAVQVFDQQVTPKRQSPFALADQRAHLGHRLGIDHATSHRRTKFYLLYFDIA